MATVHVIGAGLAGLATALALGDGPHQVRVHEAASQAGGRCRSYHDPVLGARIDNGNHLVLSGNPAVGRYLNAIGASDSLSGPDDARFPFLDLESGERWTLCWRRGRIPWWLLRPSRRVPGTRLAAYLGAIRLARAGPEASIGEVVDVRDPLFTRLIEPLAKAILNTPVAEGSAALLGRVLRETFGQGAQACRPLVARDSLAASFVDPAVERLARQDAIRFGSRLRRLEVDGRRVRRLLFGAEAVDLGPDDQVVLAVPATVARHLLPGLACPDRHHAIVNAHFALDRPVDLPGGSVLLGLIGGTAEWLFVRGTIVSVTVSAADALGERPAAAIADALWSDVARALGLPGAPRPPYRIVKERRATFAQTPDQVRRRPPTRTGFQNLLLAGDWTDTGLPATIEGAIRSGEGAADTLLNRSATFPR